MHDRRGRCRYQQPGWRDCKNLPPLNRPVMARRGREVFLAARKEFPAVPGPGMETSWVHLTCGPDKQPMNMLMAGITHWRELRTGERGREQWFRLGHRKLMTELKP